MCSMINKFINAVYAILPKLHNYPVPFKIDPNILNRDPKIFLGNTITSLESQMFSLETITFFLRPKNIWIFI